MEPDYTIEATNIRFNGGDETQFDTHDICEVFELFHHFLIESSIELKSVEAIELVDIDEKSGATVEVVETL